MLYKAHGPVAPGPDDAVVEPLRHVCFLWFQRVNADAGKKLELLLDATGVFWSREA